MNSGIFVRFLVVMTFGSSFIKICMPLEYNRNSRPGNIFIFYHGGVFKPFEGRHVRMYDINQMKRTLRMRKQSFNNFIWCKDFQFSHSKSFPSEVILPRPIRCVVHNLSSLLCSVQGIPNVNCEKGQAWINNCRVCRRFVCKITALTRQHTSVLLTTFTLKKIHSICKLWFNQYQIFDC